MRPHNRQLVLVLACCVALGLGACGRQRQVQGYIVTDEELEKIKPGVHDQASVSELLGSPSSIATFGDQTWYYITRTTSQFAFLEREVESQQVVAVQFNDAGIVSEVRRYHKEDGRIVDPVDRVTPTRGKELTLLEQLFGNFGRFNSDAPK